MNTAIPPSVRQVAARFTGNGDAGEISRHGRGLVNDTYLVAPTGQQRFILQRINAQVFPDPGLILGNLRVLADHARNHPVDGLRIPHLYPADDQRDFVIDDQGYFWRAMEFISGTRTLDTLSNANEARALGLALVRFHRLLHELPVDTLNTTLPGFHVAPEYLRHFDAMAVDSVANPGIALRDALVFVEERRESIGVLQRARQSGDLEVRPTHGDPKLDNVLFDADSDNAVALVDLDTVQPGLIQVDIADCLRSCCNRAGEQPADLYSVRFDLELARTILLGYMEEAGEFWSRSDYEYLYDAIRLIPFELGLRFLTDHFAGDRYFKVTRSGQNLERARVQFRLAEDIERQETRLRRFLDSLAHG